MAAPSMERFFMNIICCIDFATGSVIARKLCIMTVTGTRKSTNNQAPYLVPGCDPVHKVSIIPRGRALGVTVQIPEEDIHCYTKEMLVSHIKVLMGGRAAEELIFNTTIHRRRE
jgi:Peptidase family M41